MNLSLGIVFLFIGAALIWVASHGLDAASPWEVYQKVIAGLREEVTPDADEPGRGGASVTP